MPGWGTPCPAGWGWNTRVNRGLPNPAHTRGLRNGAVVQTAVYYGLGARVTQSSLNPTLGPARSPLHRRADTLPASLPMELAPGPWPPHSPRKGFFPPHLPCPEHPELLTGMLGDAVPWGGVRGRFPQPLPLQHFAGVEQPAVFRVGSAACRLFTAGAGISVGSHGDVGISVGTEGRQSWEHRRDTNKRCPWGTHKGTPHPVWRGLEIPPQCSAGMGLSPRRL